MPTPSQRNQQSGRIDMPGSSEDLLRQAVAMDAEQVDRAYEAMCGVDARTAVHQLAATALQSFAPNTGDAPAHLRAAYEQTSPGSPRVQRPQSASGALDQAEGTTGAARARRAQLEEELKNMSTGLQSLHAEFVRQADAWGIDPAPVPHIYPPHERIAAYCRATSLILTALGVY